MTSWYALLAVAGGGAIGSVCRYGISVAATTVPGGSSYLGTATANVLGCAMMGGLISYVDISSQGPGSLPEPVRLAIQVGFLGGLTTYSTFAAEKAILISQGRLAVGSLYIAVNIFLGWAVLTLAAQAVRAWMDPA